MAASQMYGMVLRSQASHFEGDVWGLVGHRLESRARAAGIAGVVLSI